MWLSFAIGYAFLTSLHIPIIKKISIKTNSLGYIFQNGLFVIPLLVVLTILTTGIPQLLSNFWFYVIAASAIQFLGLYLAVKAFRMSEISFVTPVGSLTPLLITVFGIIFLSEHVTYAIWLGIGIITIGAYLLNVSEERINLSKPFRKLLTNRGAQLFIVANIVWAFYPVFIKKAVLATKPFAPFWVALIIEGFVALFAGLLLIRQPVQLKPKRQIYGLLAMSAVIVCMQLFTELTSYHDSDIGKVAAIFKLSVLFTVLWGWLFFKEKHFLQRLIAAAMMMAGVLLIVL